MTRLPAIALFTLLLAACKPSLPTGVLPPDELAELLYDYHLSQAVSMDSSAVAQELFMQAALEEHGVTKEQLDSTLVYYYRRTDKLLPVYQSVARRLEAQAVMLGASVGGLNNQLFLTANGDTADVWTGSKEQILTPYPLLNRMDIVQQADTSFYPGDKLQLRFSTLFLQATNQNRDAVAYLAVKYHLEKPSTHDTLVCRSVHISTSTNSQTLNIEPPSIDATPVYINGYFYMNGGSNSRSGQKSASASGSSTQLLFLKNIQLIRFHQKHEEDHSAAADSLTTSASPIGTTVTDSTRGRTAEPRGGTAGQIDKVAGQHPERHRPVLDTLRPSRR